MDTPTREDLPALIEEIELAFRDVSRENGVSLSEAWVIDDCGSDEERAKARAQDKDEIWRDIPDEDIRHGYSCLSFLDEIGFRYYMPAYMIWTLRNYEDWDSNTPDSTVFSLTLDDLHQYEVLRELNRQLGRQKLRGYEQMRAWTLKRFSIFTLEQSTAIAHFLQFIAKYYEDKNARRALSAYWHKFA